jgi:RNA methyltransferase, TrmH family
MTKKQMSYVRALRQSKFRRINGQFIAEGPKVVEELIASDFKIATVFATETWIESNIDLLNDHNLSYDVVSPKELYAVSRMKEPNDVLAIVYQKEIPEELDISGLTLALYAISDPGNMGSILRTADWFGITNIFCSFRTVDIYNPKVVQASMGSISRLTVTYLDFEDLFAQCNEVGVPIYGTIPGEKNIYEIDFPKTGMIVIGNEANGIKEKYFPFFTDKVAIPPIYGRQTESLNAAVATAIIVSEIRRKIG